MTWQSNTEGIAGMMMLKTVVVFSVAIAAVQCDILDDVKGAATGVGGFFTDKFTDFKSLFVNNESDLQQNVDKVKGLLKTISGKADTLRPLANDAQKAALGKVGEMTTQVENFEQKTKTQAGMTFEQKKSEWEQLVQKVFQGEGLQGLISLVKGKGNGVSSLFASVLSLAVPVLLVFRS